MKRGSFPKAPKTASHKNGKTSEQRINNPCSKMKILFLTTAFNGMAQRLWLELDRLNHLVVVQTAESTEAMEEAVKDFQPDLIIAPYLKAKIPESIWKKHLCLVVHPGIVGDRGASSLEWAILRGEKEWGVTVLQAVEKMDAGPVWSHQTFPMREVSKAEMYRCEVTQAATRGILDALQKWEKGSFSPVSAEEFSHDKKGKWNPKIKPSQLSFQWEDSTEEIYTKIRAADSDPGAPVQINGKSYLAYGAHREAFLKGKPGELLAQKDQAVCIATADAALWISHLKTTEKQAIKLPAMMVLKELEENLPKAQGEVSYAEINSKIEDEIAYLSFDFYNGAMNTDQCERLRKAFVQIKQNGEVKVIVLTGGRDFWSNGIHLNCIEAAENPADESWTNIQAMDDLILEIIQSTDHYIISALRGNAGAGGVALALAADKVLAREGIVINPHTRNMGLYGSEYWTYLLPRRIGKEKALQFTQECLPWGTAIAKEIGLIDDCYGQTPEEFLPFVKKEAQKIAALPWFDKLIKAKKFQRLRDERYKALAKYREEELREMQRNFYENNLGYHEKRRAFVYKTAQIHLPENLYSKRRVIYRKRKWEAIHYENPPTSPACPNCP